MNQTKTECVMTQICFFYLFLTLTFDLSDDKELKRKHFGVGFI